MDYEKLYKEALQRAKDFENGEAHYTINKGENIMHWIFPELKESEDERIRKEIIYHIQNCDDTIDEETEERMIAWLEKQSQENMVEALQLEYEKGKFDALQKQKKEWDAEDLLNRNEIADILQEYNRDDLIDWLERQKPVTFDSIEYERIRKAIIESLPKYGYLPQTSIKVEDAIAWLERQESVGEIVAKYKNSWYNEGKIVGMAKGLTNDEKYQQGWHDALEKQGEQKQDPCERCEDKCLNCHDIPCLEKRAFELGKTALEAIKEVKADNANKVVVEPKFKVGDWIVEPREGEPNGLWHIERIEDNHYWEGFIGVCIEHVDEHFHLWTIADAKDGDVLVCPKYAGDIIPNIFIFKDIKTKDNDVYCHCSFLKEFRIEGYIANADPINTDFYPATKEQQGLLFQKMKEAGYEWDDEKKEPKKIEQKSIQPIFAVGDTIIKKHNSDIANYGLFTITDIIGGKYWYYSTIICDINEQEDWELVKPIEEVNVYDYGMSFTAKDSELQEVTYYIPEGFHAEIKENMVTIKRNTTSHPNVVEQTHTDAVSPDVVKETLTNGNDYN